LLTYYNGNHWTDDDNPHATRCVLTFGASACNVSLSTMGAAVHSPLWDVEGAGYDVVV
jgi:hypothetical protein